MIQSWHVELKYKLSTSPQLTLTINHTIYCRKCVILLFNIKNKHICGFVGRFLLVFDDIAND